MEINNNNNNNNNNFIRTQIWYNNNKQNISIKDVEEYNQFPWANKLRKWIIRSGEASEPELFQSRVIKKLILKARKFGFR